MYSRFINWFSTTPVGRWLVINLAARLDPVLYKLTGGKLTTVGPQVIPQLVLTSTGRKSGQKRNVQLGFTADGPDYLIVASNLGGKSHPGWSYNLDAIPTPRSSSERTPRMSSRRGFPTKKKRHFGRGSRRRFRK